MSSSLSAKRPDGRREEEGADDDVDAIVTAAEDDNAAVPLLVTGLVGVVVAVAEAWSVGAVIGSLVNLSLLLSFVLLAGVAFGEAPLIEETMGRLWWL